jgi:hypothetical protein
MLSIKFYKDSFHPREDHRGVDLLSDVLAFGRLWYGEPDAISDAVDGPKFRSRSHDAVIGVYDEAGNVIETHEHAGDFKQPRCFPAKRKRNHELAKRLPGRFSSVKKFRAFTAFSPRRVFESADHSGADRTWDRAGAAQE